MIFIGRSSEEHDVSELVGFKVINDGILKSIFKLLVENVKVNISERSFLVDSHTLDVDSVDLVVSEVFILDNRLVL